MEDDKLKIELPLYMAGMMEHCWKCGEKTPIVALLTTGLVDEYNPQLSDEVCILNEVTELPEDLLKYIVKRVPTYQFRYSKTAGFKYYGNTCRSCGSLQGDFYLHNEPGAAFFPNSEDEASRLFLTEIPLDSAVYLEAGIHIGTGDLILEFAQRSE